MLTRPHPHAPRPRPRPWPSRPRPQPPKPRPRPRMSENATVVIWLECGTVYLAKHWEISSNSYIRCIMYICKCLFHSEFLVIHITVVVQIHECLQQQVWHSCLMWMHDKAACRLRPWPSRTRPRPQPSRPRPRPTKPRPNITDMELPILLN